jgi:uncharacterized protein YbjT (DUF2867 family)
MHKNSTNQRLTIAIAGASGFIGRWFIDTFKHKFNIIAISRRELVEEENSSVEWRQADLYSIGNTISAIAGADFAIYLVHSMMPSTRLNQGSFEDTDLILADNFSRACEINDIKQILYVGGILPNDTNDLSPHLRSRLEVEQTLGSRSTPLTAIRAGIIVGPGGSSFTIIEKLVRRLPIMGCPEWTLSKTQPISLRNMLEIMYFCMGNPTVYNEVLEVGGAEVLTYKKMMQITAEVMGKKRRIFAMPVFPVWLSTFWVSKFTDSSRTFISPLVESLKHEMIADSHPILKELNLDYLSFEDSVRDALNNKASIPQLPKKIKDSAQEIKERNTVRSVQRLANPLGKSATWVGKRYTHWLPNFFQSFIQVNTDEEENCTFHVLGIESPILKLNFIKDRSHKDRQLFYISGGLLDKRADMGWLEFREVLGGKYVLAAIHDFVPKLPWYVYVSTQAVVHLWVMNSFNKYLKKMKPRAENLANIETARASKKRKIKK